MRSAVRFVMKGAACVAAGFVVTVAIAWAGAAYSIEPGRRAGFTPETFDAQWRYDRLMRVLPAPSGYEYVWETKGLVAHERLVTRERMFVSLRRRPVPLAAAEEETAREPAPSAVGFGGPMVPEEAPFGTVRIWGRAADRYLAGWPLRALEWSDPRLIFDNRRSAKRDALDNAWDFGAGFGTLRMATGSDSAWRGLPLRPTGWGKGLIVNTLVWSAAAAPLLWGPGLVRRSRRKRRGLCLSCGYPARDASGRTLAQCPECGTVMAAAGSGA